MSRLARFVDALIAAQTGTIAAPPTSGSSFIQSGSLAGESLSNVLAFARIPDVYSCTSRLQASLAERRLIFRDARGETIESATARSIAALFERVNAEDSSFDLIESVVGALLLNGNAYLFLDYGGSDRPREIFCLPAHQVRPKVDESRYVESYIMTDDHGRETVIPADQMVHVRMYSPDDGLEGMSPLDAARVAYRTARDSRRWLQQFYERGGSVSGVFSCEDSLLPVERERVETDLRLRYAGQPFRPVILPRALKWEQTGLSLEDMKFVETAQLAREDICNIFKVPPVVLGMKEGGGLSDAGATTDLLLYWEQGVRPLARRIEHAITKKILRHPRHMAEFGAGITCEFDFSDVLALQAVFQMRAVAYKNIVGRPVLTVNEARHALNLTPIDGGDELHVEQPFGVPSPAANQEQAATVGQRVAHGRARNLRMASALPDSIEAAKATRDRQLTRWEREMRTGVRQLLDQQEERVVEALSRIELGEPDGAGWRTNGNGSTVTMRAAIDIDLLMREDPADEKLMRRFMRRVVEGAGQEELAALALDIAFDVQAREVAQWLDQRAGIMIRNTTETTRARLRDMLAEGVDNREHQRELLARVREVFNDRRSNAETIVRTETASSFNFAATTAWDQSGVVIGKKWLTMGDDLVRDEHQALDRVAVALDEPFSMRGQLAMFPGDHTLGADPAFLINCRCSVSPVLDQSELQGSDPLSAFMHKGDVK